jgi:hypothetical protein
MVWLFLSVVLIAVVYLAIQFPAFRKAIWVCLALLSAGAGWLYYAKIEDDKRAEKRAEFSRRLIRPDEIVFTDLGLRHSFGWEVKGNVTNRSSHELSGFTLKVIVQDCPVSGGRCTTIGEGDASTYISVPPNQMRAFELYVSLPNMPKPTKLEWSYTVQEVRGEVK